MGTSLISALISAQVGRFQLAVAARLSRTDSNNPDTDERQQHPGQPSGRTNVPDFAGANPGYGLAIAALTSFTPSALAHSAGPAIAPISQPERSTISVVGMPKALPASFSS
jgi:hypothetical protein